MWQKFIEHVLLLVKKSRFSTGRERAILLICMGIALLFWMFVKLSKTYQSTRAISLDFNLPIGLQFREPPPNGLEATISGSGWDLLTNYLSRHHPTVIFDLPALLRHEIQRPEIMSKIEESASIKVIDLSLNYLLLLLDSTASKKVQLVLDQNLEFRPDFSPRDSILLSPDSVTVFGAASLLERVHYLSTENLTLNNIEQDVRRKLNIVNPEPGLIRLSEEQAELTLRVEQFTEKVFTIPILIVNATDSIAIVPASAEIKCVAGLSRYDELDASDFVIVANFEDVFSLREENTVPLTLTGQPGWVRSVEYFPKAVEYLIIR